MLEVGIAKETHPGETRVAAVPETVAKMVNAGMQVYVQAGAGLLSHVSDIDYTQAGATLVKDARALVRQAKVLLKVRPPMQEVNWLEEETVLISPIAPYTHRDLVAKLQKKNITTFALDLLPRIARVQAMDVLSSMSNLAGYKSVIMAASYIGKIFPMLTTAAGTIVPAKVLVIGAGVAGLQAIATARRLGGVVIAFDTRPVVEEQVKSLGAEFVSLDVPHEQAQDAGGYGKEQAAEFYHREQQIIASYLQEADVVITTALIPGRRAPVLLTEEMVQHMKQGSVIVDLAAEQQGNCVLTELGKIITKHGVTIIGIPNLENTMPVHASQLYSKNIFTFLQYVAPQLQESNLDFSDEIIKSSLLTYGGEIMNSTFKNSI